MNKNNLYVKKENDGIVEEFIFRPTGELFQHITTAVDGTSKHTIQYYQSGRKEKEEDIFYVGKRKTSHTEREFFDTDDIMPSKSFTDHIIGYLMTYSPKDGLQESFYCPESSLDNDIDRAKRQQHIMEKELFKKFPELEERRHSILEKELDSDEAVIWRSDYRQAFISNFCEQPRFALLNKHFDEVFPKTELDKEVEKIEKEIKNKGIKDAFKGIGLVIKNASQQAKRVGGLNQEILGGMVDETFNPENPFEEDNTSPKPTKEEIKKAIMKQARENLAKKEKDVIQNENSSQKQQYSLTSKDTSNINITINALKNKGR